MKSTSNIVLKLLGILLLTAAVLKGWQLLTEPMANNDIWTNRAFLIFTVEFEIALGIWLLSGLFKKVAWLVTISCFSLFSFITLYKGLSGAESCGCFGSIHVNPWITLFAVDIPAVIALLVFRPKLSSFSKRTSTRNYVKEMFTPLPSIPRISTIFGIGIMLLITTATVLAFNKPAGSTSSYELLEPETWIGKELPILKHIDIAERIAKGNWLILLYHHDCHDCITAIAKCEHMAQKLDGNKDFLQIALIEVPPFDTAPFKTNCYIGRLTDLKQWFVTTPAVVLITNGKVKKAWEEKTPDFDTIFEIMATLKKEKSLARTVIRNFISTKWYLETLKEVITMV